jgi:hypothetical protein
MPGAQKLHQSLAGGLARPHLKEVGRRFHPSHLLRHRRRNPLVQRHAIVFRQPLRRLLDRERKL